MASIEINDEGIVITLSRDKIAEMAEWLEGWVGLRGDFVPQPVVIEDRDELMKDFFFQLLDGEGKSNLDTFLDKVLFETIERGCIGVKIWNSEVNRYE